jgi:hypothetical protein
LSAFWPLSPLLDYSLHALSLKPFFPCSQLDLKHQASKLTLSFKICEFYSFSFSQKNIYSNYYRVGVLCLSVPCFLCPQMCFLHSSVTPLLSSPPLIYRKVSPHHFINIYLVIHRNMIPMPEKLFKLCKSMGLDILSKWCSWQPSQLLNVSIITKESLNPQLPSFSHLTIPPSLNQLFIYLLSL